MRTLSWAFSLRPHCHAHVTGWSIKLLQVRKYHRKKTLFMLWFHLHPQDPNFIWDLSQHCRHVCDHIQCSPRHWHAEIASWHDPGSCSYRLAWHSLLWLCTSPPAPLFNVNQLVISILAAAFSSLLRLFNSLTRHSNYHLFHSCLIFWLFFLCVI